MVIIFPREFIFPAKKRPPHAPIDAMHDLNLPVRQHIPPIRPSHAKPPRDRYALNAITTCVSLDPGYRNNETKLTIDGWPRASPHQSMIGGWPRAPVLCRALRHVTNYRFQSPRSPHAEIVSAVHFASKGRRVKVIHLAGG
jgi:hypothetical protein